MGPIKAVTTSYARMFNLTGRATRSEYWWFMLFQIIASALIGVAMVYYVMSLGAQLDENSDPAQLLPYGGLISLGWFVLFTIPATTSLVRRLHDSDHSGWWYWIVLVPIVGIIVLFIFMVLPSSEGSNRFGRHPLARRHRHNAPKVYAPEIMAKRAKTEAARRAEIMDYYRKNVATNT